MNNYHMRREDREIKNRTEIDEILFGGKYLTLALCKENEPYIVTLSYGYQRENNAIYLHAAKEGLKHDFIRLNPKVCATIIEDLGYIQNECGHEYRSLVIRGTLSYVEELDEKKQGMEYILKQLENTPSIIKERSLKNDNVYSNVSILRLDINEITGKKGR